MQLTGKEICKTCEDGRTVKEALVEIKKSSNKEKFIPVTEENKGRKCNKQMIAAALQSGLTAIL